MGTETEREKEPYINYIFNLQIYICKHLFSFFSAAELITKTETLSLCGAGYSSRNVQSASNRTDDSKRGKLLSAAASGDKNLFMSLIETSPHIDEADDKGRTALMYLVSKQQVECVDKLIHAKCDVNKVDYRGNTALMIAASNKRDKCISLLISAGA
jgi:ankyrin repeat protein